MKSVGVFWMTFAFSLAILAAVGSILLFLPSDSDAVSSTHSVSVYFPQATDNLAVLAVGKEDEKNNGQYFTLLYFDAVKSCLTLIGLPPETEVNFGVESATLNRYFQKGGGKGAVQAARQLLQIPIDAYAVLKEDHLMILADRLGGVAYDLPQALQNETVELSAGWQTLDGRRFRDAILFDSDFNLDLQLVQALFRQRLGTLSPQEGETVVEQFLSLTDTNLSAYDYLKRKSALELWATVEDPIAIFSLQGTYDEAEERFLLSPDSVEQMRQTVFGLD